MSVATSRAGSFRRVLRFEFEKLRLRRLPWLMLLLVPLSVIAGGLMDAAGETPSESWLLFENALSGGLRTATFLLVVLGSLSINEEANSGSLRAVLVRPVTREAVALAKLLSLTTLALSAAALAVLTGWAWTAAHGGFHDVEASVSGFTETAFRVDEMRGLVAKLALFTLAPLISAAFFGSLVSILVDSPGAAVAGSLAALVILHVAGSQSETIRGLAFPAQMDFVLELARSIANAESGHRDEVRQLGLASRQALLPLAAAFGLGGLTTLIFSRREIRC